MRIAFWLVQDNLNQTRSWVAGFYYVRHCLAALAALPRREIPDVVAFVPHDFAEPLLDLEPGAAGPDWLRVVPVPADALGVGRTRGALEALVAEHPCDAYFPLVSIPGCPLPGKTYGWIPDFQHLHLPEYFSPSECEFRDAVFRFLCGVCDRIVCSSETVRQDLLRFDPLAGEAAEVLRFTTRPPQAVLAQDPSVTLARLGIDRPYVYLPNQFWTHKNHATVFAAWARLTLSPRPLLVCSGATEDYRRPEHFATLQAFLADNGLTPDVRLLGLVDRHDQWQLYRGATLVLQPSRFEGWSTTIEEARSVGKPLLVSSIAPNVEQVSVETARFAPLEVDELVGQIETIWRSAASGYDAVAERAALAASDQRIEGFGRRLVEIVSRERPATISASTFTERALPLLQHYTDICHARMKVIDAIDQAAKERLERMNQAENDLSRLKRKRRRSILRRWSSRNEEQVIPLPAPVEEPPSSPGLSVVWSRWLPQLSLRRSA